MKYLLLASTIYSQIIIMGDAPVPQRRFPNVSDIYQPHIMMPVELWRSWEFVRKHDLDYADEVVEVSFDVSLDYKSTVLAYVSSEAPYTIKVNTIYRDYPDQAEKVYDIPHLLRHELAHVRQINEDQTMAGPIGRILKEREADQQARLMFVDYAEANGWGIVQGGGWCEDCMITVAPGCDLSPECLSTPVEH